jgi:hypothetical protein
MHVFVLVELDVQHSVRQCSGGRPEGSRLRLLRSSKSGQPILSPSEEVVCRVRSCNWAIACMQCSVLVQLPLWLCLGEMRVVGLRCWHWVQLG